MWAAFFAAFIPQLKAADPSSPAPAAFVTAPPCSRRPGVRAIRSDLIQFGAVTASLSAQAAREGQSCLQTAALWVTRKNISQQYELRDAAVNTFAILDIAPDSDNILLSSVPAAPNPDADHSAQFTVLSLPDGSLKWTPIADVLGLKNCAASFEPQGFIDATHVSIAARPVPSTLKHPSCTTKTLYFDYDLTTRAVKQSSTPAIRRFAQSVAGPIHSCKSDPDVIAACYTARARLAVSPKGDGMKIWPVGGTHLMSVDKGMLPGNLSSEVGPNMRVYATMVICPLTVERGGPSRYVCVDAATDFHPDPLHGKPTRSVTTKTVFPTAGRHR